MVHGSSTITVKANNGVSSSVKINVYSPVTDIVLGTENIVLQMDETFKITASVLPEDANNKKISFKSENENIAKVDDEGNVTGVLEGSTNILVTSQENNISKTVKVNVIKKLQDGEIIFDESLKINGNEISGLENKNNTVDKIVNKIKTNHAIEIYNAKGDKLSGNNLVGTGSIIKILDNNNLIMEYNVIMYGDVTGDGKINSVDLLILQRHILEIEKFSGVFVKAGNVRKNGRNPSSVDCLLIQRHILGLQNLEQ